MDTSISYSASVFIYEKDTIVSSLLLLFLFLKVITMEGNVYYDNSNIIIRTIIIEVILVIMV